MCSSFLTFSHAQVRQKQDSSVKFYVDTLIYSMQQGADDSTRLLANSKFDLLLFQALQMPASFKMDFDTVKNVAVQTSPDNKFRLYTWTVASTDGSEYSYYGYLQVRDKNGKIKLFALRDSSSVIRKPESEKLKTDRWYGCVYYKIIPVKKAGKVYYTLLGWKGQDTKTSQKLIDVLYFDKEIPKLGYPLLKAGKVFRNRVIFSFMASLSMVLRYEEQKKMIVFDHLSGSESHGSDVEVSGLNGPDGSYDAFKFKRGRWLLLNDVDIRSSWKPKKNIPKAFGDKE